MTSPVIPRSSNRLSRCARVLFGALLALAFVGGGSWGAAVARAQQPNGPPAFSASETGHRSIAENSSSGTSIGAPFSATDPEGEAVTYSLQKVRTGDTTTVFSIDATTGQLSTSEPLDFETRRVYLITVRASDEQGNGTSRAITVRVTDVDEAPSITRLKPANAPATDSTSLRVGPDRSPVATFAARDPEGGPVTWTLGGADAARFSISSAGELSFAVTPDLTDPADAGGDNIYDVTLRATDAAGNTSDDHAVQVTMIGIIGADTFVRNEGGDRFVGFFSLANKPEHILDGDEKAWFVTGEDAGKFDVTYCRDFGCPQGIPNNTLNGVLRFRTNPPDFSNPSDSGGDNTYHVSVGWHYDLPRVEFPRLPVTVTVRDVGGAPTVKAPDDRKSAALSLTEGDGGGQTFEFLFTISDPAGQSLSTVLAGADGSQFHLFHSSGSLWFLALKGVPDYESPTDQNGDNVYEVLVKAHNGINTTIRPVTLTVTDIPENPRLHGPTATKFEVGGSGTVASYIGADDAGPVSFSLAGANSDLFTIDGDGALTYVTAPTATATHTVEVRAGAGGRTSTQSLTVTVVASGTNTAPGAITGRDTASTNEEFSALGETGDVGTYRSTDADGDTIYWSLSGDDAAYFWIGHDGKLRYIYSLDYENALDSDGDNVYNLTVTASDGIASVSKAVAVTVVDVNEPPIVTGPMSVSRAGGTDLSVGSYAASDPEQSSTITWSVVGKDAEDFAISASGALSFKTAPDFDSPADADSDNVYHVVVKASDGTAFDTVPVEVTITGTVANTAPTITAGPATANHAENSTAAIGTYRATDADGGRIEWSLSGDDAGEFTINGAGKLSFRAAPDFESPADADTDNAYEVTVTASDDSDSATQDVTVTVTDVDEAPVVSGPTDVTRTSFGDTAVATYTAADPEGATGIVFGLEGEDAGSFAFDQTTGQLSFKASPVFGTATSADRDNLFEVTVSATVDGKKGKLRVLIPLHDRNLAPTIADGGATLSTAENSTGTLHDYDATDPEGKSVAWALSGDDAGDFRIDSSGRLSFAAAPDFENPADTGEDNNYQVTVLAVDGPHRTPRAVTVTVTNVDEAGSVTLPAVIPRVNRAIAATLNDPEGGISGVSWQWSHAGGGDISGATSASYTPTASDLNRRLEVAVSYSDAQGPNKSASARTGTIRRENNAPQFGAASATRSVTEGSAARVDLGAPFTATDADQGDTLTYSLSGADAALFAIHSATGQLSTRATLDFEAASTRTVLVRATDTAGDTATMTVTVFVTDVEEPGVVTLSTNSPRVGTAVRATLRDPDGVAGSVGWQWTAGGTTIGGAHSASYTPVADDAGKRLSARATYRDGRGPGKTAAASTSNPVSRQTTNWRPPISPPTPGGPGGGGGGGGGSGGPSPSTVDYEWTVKHDIEALDSGNDLPTGSWSDGDTLWIVDNGEGADDEVYAYDLETGERVPEREFALDPTNRAPRGFWSDGETVWVSDSGRDHVFAYDLASGERLEEREVVLAEDNADARGIWSDGQTLWVLDARPGALYAYDLESGSLLGRYDLDARNGDPHGIWSDGFTVWVSDHGTKTLFAYPLPEPPRARVAAVSVAGEVPAGISQEDRALRRADHQDFTHLSSSSNNSPRGIWSDGDLMYVVDASDDRIYTYNMPDAIDARLASLSLSGVDIGEFDAARRAYDGAPGEGVRETTVSAEAVQRRATVVIEPPDADGDPLNGHQVAIGQASELRVTVTSADGSRRFVYRVRVAGGAGQPECLRGPVVAGGFSLVLSRGVDEDELATCAAGSGVAGLHALHEGRWVSYVPGAPEVVNLPFHELFAGGLPAGTPLAVKGGGEAPGSDLAGSGASLASLTLEGVRFGAFSPHRTEYAGVAVAGVAHATVSAVAAAPGATLRIEPADADGDPGNGHQAAIEAGRPITVTVTSADGARSQVYRVWVGDETPDGGGAAVECLQGDIAGGFNLVVFAGGAIEQLAACARSLDVALLYALVDGAYLPYALDAPDSFNQGFRELFPHGLPPDTPLVAAAGAPDAAASTAGEGEDAP